jgi:hypothetical protein
MIAHPVSASPKVPLAGHSRRSLPRWPLTFAGWPFFALVRCALVIVEETLASRPEG